MLLAHLLRYIIRKGTLRVRDSRGKTHVFSGEPGPTLSIGIATAAAERKILLHPTLFVGEAYMDGTLTVEDGGAFELIDFFAFNTSSIPRSILTPLYDGLGHRFRWLQQHNPLERSRRNVAHHYDLSDTLYDLFLDADRQYSCAYFADPKISLEQAQVDKKRHLAAKLLLEPGMRVLDIGCGWGGLALYLAQECGVKVTGLTLSVEQLKVAQRRAAELGLSDRVKFELVDYRNAQGSYDRIVSVGMFEHVGAMQYETFFTKVNGLLSDDGVAVLHSIGRADGPGQTNAWIRKYIFPGGYCPALSEVLPVVERAKLWVTDIEILRLHYAETLRQWRQRFFANRDKIKAVYDERFCRMWEFYLAGCEVAFRRQGHMVFQIQMAKKIETVPLTRDYITDWERVHAPQAKSTSRKSRAA